MINSRCREILGVAGPNGSGKTTLIRCLLGLLAPTSGAARVGGTDARALGAGERSRLGYMPQHEAVYRDLTVRENVRFFADLYRVEDRAGAVEAARDDIDVAVAATDDIAFALSLARFAEVSLDLIYALPDQTEEAWAEELCEAAAFGARHLSLYQLTIEPGTAFGKAAERGTLRPMPDDRAADFYEITAAVTSDLGLPAYEVSNHAASGAESRHNLTYWRCGDWVGVGPGAHGRFWLDGRRIATAALSAPGAWLVAVEAGGRPEERDVVEDPWKDYFMMGLRLREGILLSRFEALGGRLDEGHVAELVEAELLERCDGRLRTTSAGRPLLNAILRRLL